MRTRLALIFVLLATLFAWAQADAGFPGTGKKFPNAASGPPVVQPVFAYCFPTAITPCASAAVAPSSTTITTGAGGATTKTFTVVTKITAGALNPFAGATGYVIRLLRLPAANYVINSVWIGASATTGTCTTGSGRCSWDFVNPTQLTSGSATSFTVSSGATQLLLDNPITGTLQSGVAYTLAMDIAASNNFPTFTPNTTTFNTSPKACGAGNGCAYNSWTLAGAGLALCTTCSISSTTLTITTLASGSVHVGDLVTGSGVSAGTIITALVSGTGGTGTYTVNNSQTVGGEAMTLSQAASTGKGNAAQTGDLANSAYKSIGGGNIVIGLGTLSVQ